MNSAGGHASSARLARLGNFSPDDFVPPGGKAFGPAGGEQVHWVNLDCSDPDAPKKIDEGDVTADQLGLVTVRKFVVGKNGWGNRLVLTRGGGK